MFPQNSVKTFDSSRHDPAPYEAGIAELLTESQMARSVGALLRLWAVDTATGQVVSHVMVEKSRGDAGVSWERHVGEQFAEIGGAETLAPYRRRGIAQMLTGQAVRWCQSNGLIPCFATRNPVIIYRARLMGLDERTPYTVDGITYIPFIITDPDRAFL